MFFGEEQFIKGQFLHLGIECSTLEKACSYLSGFASDDNGLISVNASSDEAETKSAGDDSMIKIFKEDTLGRLLIGYGCRREEDNFYIQGLRAEERINSSGFDEEGFIIAD